MPRAARYRVPAFEELERQLTFAPPDALRRQMEAAERLAHEVADDATYPFEFVLWRLTGFRASDADLTSVRGDRLRADLATFVLHISERIQLTHDERPGGAVAVTEFARELGVTDKTLRRWRGRGLVAHRMLLADGRSRVAIYRQEAERFVARHPSLVEDARDFTRMDEATERAALARVQALVRSGATPNLAAKQAASELGRSHETIRQLLLRVPMEAAPVAAQRTSRRSLDRAAWERKLAYRSWRWGVPVERVAEAGGTTADAIRRRIDAVRAERLRGLRLSWVEFPTFERADAAETILGADIARTDLAPRCDPSDVVTMLRTIGVERATPVARGEALEESLVAVYSFLKRRARHGIAELGRAPDRRALDRIETDLRWALRVKRRAVERLLPIALLRAEQTLGGGLDRRPVEEIRLMLTRCVELVAEVVESVDPTKRQAPRRLVALDTDRLLAQHAAPAKASRAAVRHEVGAIAMPGLFSRIAVWAELVEPLARFEPALQRLEPAARALLCRRYGWGGERPLTLEELAAEERTTVGRLTARLLVAERALRGRRG